jgi:uncharacterized membrane protein YjfL (UPF0719 family)
MSVFGTPLILGTLSAIGLASALIGDGLLDVLSWVALALPVAVVCFFAARRRPPQTTAGR